MAHVELVAEREGTVALKLLREFDWCLWSMWAVALPALEAHLRVTGAIAAVANHVKYVLFGHSALRRPPLAGVVVRAVDVQVVIDVDLHSEALSP